MINFVSDPRFQTMGDILRWRAESDPDFPLYTYLLDGETEEVQLTLGQLDQTARAIAATLQMMTKKGDRALLLYPAGLEFVAAFFGCLYAGVLAVPVTPPRHNRPDERLRNIAQDAEPTVVLTTSELREKSIGNPELAPALPASRWLATDSLPLHLADHWRETPVSRADLAFLQYTSGSTGQPKGVMVTHDNLLHNEQWITEAFGHDEATIVAGWLPFFHDMGLVGNLLQPLYIGRPVILMAPIDFLQKPIRWLQMISRYRATTSGGPNFAYDLCVQKTTPEQRAGLDLSSWTLAFNGAEPIRAATLQNFARHFAPFGFRLEALYPCYGMAEATLFITGAEKAKPPKLQPVLASLLEQNQVRLTSPDLDDARTLVGCGKIRPGIDLRIVDPERHIALAPGTVGEIWLAGPSVAAGYWQQPAATATTFGATLAAPPGVPDEGPFLRTGDLGFIADGELYITGRLKDLIIIRGRNHYPQDLEATVAASHAALRAGGGAVFTAEVAGAERLVVVQEVERTHLRQLDMATIVSAIRTAVAREHDLQVQVICLLRPLSIPKTSSGKIQRQRCRQLLLTHALEVVETWALSPAFMPWRAGEEQAHEATAPWSVAKVDLVTVPVQ